MTMNNMPASKKLNAHNYHDWRFRVQLILMKEGLWKLIDGKRKAPSSKSDDSAALEKWENDCESTFATICLAISNTELPRVKECKTAMEVWKKLADIYEKGGVARELYLRRQLSNFKKEEEDSMQQHINRLTEIVDGLAGLGETT